MTEEDTAFLRAALHELVAIGTELARDIAAARKAETITPTEAADAFERVARATRRTILLATRLGDTPRADGAPDRAAARREIIRAVEDAITREPGLDAEARHRTESEFRERLDAPELAEDLGARPVRAVIESILRDMDLSRPPLAGRAFRRRTPEALRRLHALARGEAAPLPAPAEIRPEAEAPGPSDLELHAFIMGRGSARSRPPPDAPPA